MAKRRAIEPTTWQCIKIGVKIGFGSVIVLTGITLLGKVMGLK
jgi:hypothetical protein